MGRFVDLLAGSGGRVAGRDCRWPPSWSSQTPTKKKGHSNTGEKKNGTISCSSFFAFLSIVLGEARVFFFCGFFSSERQLKWGNCEQGTRVDSDG